MNELFDKLGAVARRAADSVTAEVTVAAQEQKIRDCYRALGKLCYKAHKEGAALAGAEFDELYSRIDECLRHIEMVRDSRKVTVEPTPEKPADVTADETDFVIVED